MEVSKKGKEVATKNLSLTRVSTIEMMMMTTLQLKVTTTKGDNKKGNTMISRQIMEIQGILYPLPLSLLLQPSLTLESLKTMIDLEVLIIHGTL